VDPPVCCSRPSIDVLFESAAGAYRGRTIGVVLTGANADGALGAARLAALGATIIVQDPATAEGTACPLATLERVPDARVLSLAEIGPQLDGLCRQPRRAT
jgi:two-component system chemotaxis response regulator CheB